MKTISFSMTLALVFSLVSRNSLAAPGEGDVSGKGWSPFQFSIYSPIQLVGENKSITGLRLSLLYGKNTDISGIDLGLGVNDADTAKGIQIGGLGSEVDYLSGIQIAGIAIAVRYDAFGIQIALVANESKGTIKGIQIGGINNLLAPKTSSVIGVQVGLFNFAGDVTGVQIGLFNVCVNLSGIQIGLLNHIEQGRFPWMPLINAK